ncbi:TonB-dependent receptor [Nitrosococcus halophilus Nc 4]|uniref:TonB-dependent receptor n=1 Tax=Nitrosococcus halophilus (strain Nc4) TaxID=472759 RepID=D5C3D8_NITHN|nr:TonB-dependent receptor [Nitrosococcus halophilus]ADE16845.1 TonB-dependent receptor [Nitrosococcus halophilus Nc 4]
MRYSFVFLALLIGIPGAGFAADPAELSIYLFQEGRPQSGVKLVVDGQQSLSSDRDGAIRLAIESGSHRLSFSRSGRGLLIYDLTVVAGENIRLFITLFADSREPAVEVESSAVGGEKAESKQEVVKGEPGLLQGRVLSAEDGKPLAGVKLYVSGLNLEMTSDQEGTYRAELPVGEYSVSVVTAGFNTQIRDQVEIRSEEATEVVFELTPVGLELPEFVVLEPYVAGSIASIIDEQRNAATVSSVLGAEQISRAGDTDVASALKRASGLTLVGGKFIFIRGLGERFSSTLLNGASIPSPDPTRRVVPLDLFPTSVLDNVLIQKGYSVDRPGEFAGGTVSLRTRSVPEEFFIRANVSIGYNEGTTFSEGLTYEGGDTDILGFDDGTRDLPDSLAQATAGGTVVRPETPFNPDGFTAGEIEQFGENLSGVWDIDEETIGPDATFGLSLGDYVEWGDFGLGYVGAGRWDQSWNTNDEVRRAFSVSSGEELELIKDFDLVTTNREIRTSGYARVEANYQESQKLYGNLLLVRLSEDEARIQEGFTDAEPNDIRRSRLQWIENSLFTQQVGGEHRFERLGGLGFDWQYTTSEARRQAPYERRYRYDSDNSGQFSFSRRADSNQTIFADLTDNDDTIRFSVNLPLNLFNHLDLNLSSGYLSRQRERESEIRRFDFAQFGPKSRDPEILALSSLEDILAPENIGVDGFQLREATRPTDNYEATQELTAYFGQMDATFFERLRLAGGMRVEDNRQIVKTFALFNPDQEPIESVLSSVDLLPAMAATYFLSEQQQIRASYSETLSRPDFRELSPAPFTDPESDTETVGNPDLEQIFIKSYDLRWEYYFSPSEHLSAAFFWKDIQNPIEKILLPGPAGLLTLENAESATDWGIELELMKHLDFIHPRLANFYFGGNVTYTQSEIKLKPEDLDVQTTGQRPLQGHSPYIVNAQIGYDNPDRGIVATLLYNTSGERITEVGTLGAPDKYEQPFHQLDFVYCHQFGDHWRLNFKMRNLLDDEVEVLQGDKVTRAFRPGREFSIGFTWDF